jgi:sulfonate transport system permease protein
MTRRIDLAGIGGLLVFLAIWEALVTGGILVFENLPAPSAIAVRLWDLVRTPALYWETLHTLSAAIGGWLIAGVVGLLLGTAIGLSSRARIYSLATIEVLRPLPGVAFVPVALVLFGFSLQMELFVIVLPTLWPVLVNTMGGITSVPQRLHDVVEAFRLSRVDAVRKVFLPAAAPSILVGLRLSMSIALIMAVAAEMIGNPDGLGHAIVREQQALHPDRMFGYIIVVGLIGIALNAAIVAAGRLLLPGQFRRAGVGERAA